MALYFASLTYGGILLNFNKSTNFCTITNATAIEIYKIIYFDIFAKCDIRCNRSK